jgi:hypothetical protein
LRPAKRAHNYAAKRACFHSRHNRPVRGYSSDYTSRKPPRQEVLTPKVYFAV